MERKLIEPGWYREMDNDEYHTSSGVSSSRLKDFLKMAPNNILHKPRKPQSDAMLLGTIVHEAVLEGVDIEEKYIVEPDFGDCRKKDNRIARDLFREENKDKITVSAGMMQDALGMSGSILGNPECMMYLDGSINESSVYWWHRALDEDSRDYKIMCKVRPDAISRSHPGVLLDVKTTDDATETEFSKTIVKYDYHMSAAMYLDGCNRCDEVLDSIGSFAFTTFMFIVVEKTPPYNSRMFKMTSGNKALNIGKARFMRAARNYHDAKEENYPGYSSDIPEIELPGWAEIFHII